MPGRKYLPQNSGNIVNLPLIGEVDLEKQSMIVSTLIIVLWRIQPLFSVGVECAAGSDHPQRFAQENADRRFDLFARYGCCVWVAVHHTGVFTLLVVCRLSEMGSRSFVAVMALSLGWLI